MLKSRTVMFMMRMQFNNLINWIKTILSEAKVKSRLDNIEKKYKIKFDKDFKQREHKKTGIKAKKLVREMSLNAKWLKNLRN